MTSLTVIGCGYLGSVHAACMSCLGHDVVGIDTNSSVVEMLSAGKAPFFEPGFQELLEAALSIGRLSFTSDPDPWLGGDGRWIPASVRVGAVFSGVSRGEGMGVTRLSRRVGVFRSW